MNTLNIAIPAGQRASSSPAGGYTTSGFWERLWRTSGIQFVASLLIAYVISGYLPRVGAVLYGLTVLNLMWFAAALRTTLADAGRDGWGAAVTASSAALGGLIFLLVMVVATLAYSPAVSGSHSVASGLNDFIRTGVVLSSFPRAMLIMAGTFGLWRARLISNALFGAGVAAVVLVLLGGTTWMSGGFWAPDGAYSRFLSPLIGLVWVVVVSRILTQSPATRAGW
jgi:hypothetical protein